MILETLASSLCNSLRPALVIGRTDYGVTAYLTKRRQKELWVAPGSRFELGKWESRQHNHTILL